jgi:hypothetical protein
MKEAKTKSKNELLPGTLEMLILKTLSASLPGRDAADGCSQKRVAEWTNESRRLRRRGHTCPSNHQRRRRRLRHPPDSALSAWCQAASGRPRRPRRGCNEAHHERCRRKVQPGSRAVTARFPPTVVRCDPGFADATCGQPETSACRQDQARRERERRSRGGTGRCRPLATMPHARRFPERHPALAVLGRMRDPRFPHRQSECVSNPSF